MFGQIRVDPTDENSIYTLGLGLNVSRDAGKSFTTLRGMHGDHHGLWIDPANPAVLYNANDGGFYRSTDAGKTWAYDTAAGGIQFYNVTLDDSSPIWAYGSIQDYGSRRGVVDLSKGRDKIPAVAWSNAPGGEGSHHAIERGNNDIVYSHGFYGNFTREDVAAAAAAAAGRGAAQAGGQGQGRGRGRTGVTNIRPPAKDGEPELRAQWMAPVITSLHDPATVYLGFQFVFRSTNRGETWERISPDLSSNDPSQMLLKSSSAIPYQTIVALAESPTKAGVSLRRHRRRPVARDDGWRQDLDRPDLVAAGAQVGVAHRAVAPCRRHRLRDATRPRRRRLRALHLQVDRQRQDVREPCRQHSRRTGQRRPRGSDEREHPLCRHRLRRLRDDSNGGRQWQVLGGNLPSTQVSDLQVHPRDHVIVISTYGRGMWAMDARGVRAESLKSDVRSLK